MRTETGDKIIRELMSVATDMSLPESVRSAAFQKISKAAVRSPSEAVEDVVGQPN